MDLGRGVFGGRWGRGGGKGWGLTTGKGKIKTRFGKVVGGCEGVGCGYKKGGGSFYLYECLHQKADNKCAGNYW